MSVVSKSPKYLLLLALISGASTGSLSAQTQEPPPADISATVAMPASEMTEGPDIKGIISGRSGDRMQVTADDGTKSVIVINDNTKISASKGFFRPQSQQAGGDIVDQWRPGHCQDHAVG